MKKIFKKSLAIMVSAAICLTALIGCLSVSAATRGEGTFTVGSDSGKPGESVTVPIELTYTSGGEGMGIAASLFDVSFDTDALTITDIAAGEDATYMPDVEDNPGGEGVPPQDIYIVEYRSTDGETISVVDGAVRILAMPADNKAVVTSMQALLTFTINDGAEAKAYDIEITKEQTCDFGNAESTEVSGAFGNFEYTGDAEFIDMTVTNGKITVVEDAPSCEHQWEAVSADPATEKSNGLITFKCAKCEEGMTETVYYNKYSRPMFTSVSAESEILFCMGVRDEIDLSRVGTARGWSDLYFEFVQQRADGEKTSKIINYLDAEDTTMNSADVYKFSYGVASPNLGDNITGYAYTYNSIDAKWYSGESITSSVKQYTFKMLPKATDLQKTVLVDMLYYGAAAQINFGYDVDNLVNASMVYEGTDYSTYATSGTTEVIDQKSMATSSTDEYPVTFSTFSIEAESKLIFNVAFQFGSKYYNQYIDEYDGLYVVIDYIDFNGQKQSVKYYNSTVSDSKHTFSLTDGTRKFSLQFNDFTAADMRGKLTINVYKADGTKLTQDSTYSVQSYVYTKRNGSASEQLLNALNEMIQYGDACKAFLTSK